jgi:hypothetical protein
VIFSFTDLIKHNNDTIEIIYLYIYIKFLKINFSEMNILIYNKHCSPIIINGCTNEKHHALSIEYNLNIFKFIIINYTCMCILYQNFKFYVIAIMNYISIIIIIIVYIYIYILYARTI